MNIDYFYCLIKGDDKHKNTQCIIVKSIHLSLLLQSKMK